MSTSTRNYSRANVVHDGIKKMAKDTARHFRVRLPSWALASMLVAMGLNIITHPGIYSYSPALSALKPFFQEATLGYVMMGIGVSRLFALFVNGTFPPFRWSSRIRVVFTILSCFIWGNLALGSLISHEPNGLEGVCPILLLIELWCVGIASEDMKRDLNRKR